MISYGDLFKIFVIIIVIFLTLLMLIYLGRQIRDTITKEDIKNKIRKNKSRSEDKKNMMEFGKEALGTTGKLVSKAIDKS